MEQPRPAPVSTLRQGWWWCLLFLRLFAREASVAAVFVAFPSLLVVVYAQAWGGMSGFAGSCRVLLVEPAGTPADVMARNREVRRALEAEVFEGQPALDVRVGTDLEASLRLLRDGQATLVLDGQNAGVDLPLYLDPTAPMGAYAESFIREAMNKARARQGERLPHLRAAFTGGTGTSNDFLLGVPGLVLFGWVFGGLTVALLLVREMQRGTLDRLRLSNARLSGLLLGLWLAQCVMGVLQGCCTVAVAAAVGFTTTSSPAQVLLAGLVLNALVAGLGISIGVMTAALVSTEAAAANLSTMFFAPVAFLSGALFPLPVPVLFGEGAWAFFGNDFLPATPVVRVLTNVLVRGQALWADGPALVLVLVETLAWLAVAGLVFRARRWRTA